MFDHYNDFLYSIFWYIVYLILPFTLTVYLFDWLYSDVYASTKHRFKGHSWKSIQCTKLIPYNNLVTYCEILSEICYLFFVFSYFFDFQCSQCERLMLPAIGEFCERCGLSACKSCKKISGKKNSCRVLSSSPLEPFLHHWVKGDYISLSDRVDFKL